MKKWINQRFNHLILYVRKLILDDQLRKEFMFRWLNIILSVVSLGMTIVNICTNELPLMYSTLIFGMACVINVAILYFKPKLYKIITPIFFLEAGALLLYFMIWGQPNGFSVLWICLIPCFVLFIEGIKAGSIICGLSFLVVIFFFWTPVGKNLLQYKEYGDTFLLRFPFLFIAIYVLSFFIETIRLETQKQLIKTENEYKYLYRHDALTNLYNRHAFNETMQQIFLDENIKQLAFMIFDIDNFKIINDTYGHSVGDEALKHVVQIMKKVFCDHCSYSRWGGEEFTACMKCDHDAYAMAEQLRSGMDEALFEMDGIQIHFTISIGLCIVKDKKKVDVSTILKLADKCLQEAKSKGKNCIVSQTIE